MTRWETWKEEVLRFFFSLKFEFFGFFFLSSPFSSTKTRKKGKKLLSFSLFLLTSSKLALDASCSIGYPRYRRMPLSPSM